MINDSVSFPAQSEIEQKFISMFQTLDNSDLVYMTNTNYLTKIFNPIAKTIKKPSNFSFRYSVDDSERYRLREIELIINININKYLITKTNFVGKGFIMNESYITNYGSTNSDYLNINKSKEIEFIDFLKDYCNLNEDKIYHMFEKCQWNML